MHALRSKFLVTPLASASTPFAEPGELLPVHVWETSNGRAIAREPLRIEWPTSCFHIPGDGMPPADDAGHSAVIAQPGDDISRFVVALSGAPATLAAPHGGGGGGHYGGGGGGHGGGGGGHGGGSPYGRHGGRWGWGGWGGYGGWGWGGWPVYAYGWPVDVDVRETPRGITVPEAIAYLTQEYGASWWYRGAVGGVSPSGLEVVQVFVSSSEGARVLPARIGPFTVVVTVKTQNPTVGMLAGCSACAGGGFQGVITMPRKASPSATFDIDKAEANQRARRPDLFEMPVADLTHARHGDIVKPVPPTLPLRTCPACGEQATQQCRCKRSEMKCPNGHEWHHDGDDIHAGGSDHASPTCCVDKVVIARVRKLPERLMERMMSGRVEVSPEHIAKLNREAGHGDRTIDVGVDFIKLRADDPFWLDYEQFLEDKARAAAHPGPVEPSVAALGAVASKSQNYAGPTTKTRVTGGSASSAPPSTARFPGNQAVPPPRSRVPGYGSSTPPASRMPPVGRYVPSGDGNRIPPSNRYAPPTDGGSGELPPPPPAPPSSMWPPTDPSGPSDPSGLHDFSVLGPCPTPGACGPRISLGPEIPFPRPVPTYPRQGIPCGSCKLRVAQGARMSDIAVRLGVPPQVLLDANAWQPGQTLAGVEEIVAPRGAWLAALEDVEPSPSLVCTKQGGQWDPTTGKCIAPEAPGATVEPVVEQKKSIAPYVVAGGVLLVTAGLFFGTLAIKAPPSPQPKPRQRLA